MVKNLPASAGDTGDAIQIPGLERSWSRKWQPAPVFLLGKFHGQMSVVRYSPWSHKESDMTELLSMSMHEKIRQCVTESFMLGTGTEVI